LSQQPNGEELVAGAADGFVTAIKSVSIVAGIFVFLGLLLSFLLPKNAARIESEGYKPPRE
jgi:hypothetical protein